MGMEVTGKLVAAFETKQISDKFSKRNSFSSSLTTRSIRSR
jgi:hypothetical protein